MKRLFDIAVSATLIGLLSPVFLVVALAVRVTSRGPVISASRRIGRKNKIFLMHKFRTMRADTPQVATHLLSDPGLFLTPIGGFLRKSSLDELPQLLDVIAGSMSLVGPRPALFNQDDLISLRSSAGVDSLLPGITGWAQVNGRDGLSIPAKVDYDIHYLRNKSFALDAYILLLTVLKVFRRDGVSH